VVAHVNAVAHLRCGGDIRDALRMAGLLTDNRCFFETQDPVCEGPLPTHGFGATPERARWIARAWELSEEECLQRMRSHGQLHTAVANFEEVCLWFEHDLFDQASLVELLARWGANPEAEGVRSRLSLVTLNQHASVDRFVGLGQLRPEVFAALFDQRISLTPTDFEVASQAWRALCSSDPRQVETVGESSAFPFLSAALDRHLEELPSVGAGIGITERLVLERVTAGPCLAVECFQWWMQTDPQPWLGDLMFWARLRGLASGPAPLLLMRGDFPAEYLELTELGVAVADGAEDWLQHAEPSPWEGRRYRGGVEIDPSSAHWRRAHDGALALTPGLSP
jgi:hypothetical protein